MRVGGMLPRNALTCRSAPRCSAASAGSDPITETVAGRASRARVARLGALRRPFRKTRARPASAIRRLPSAPSQSGSTWTVIVHEFVGVRVLGAPRCRRRVRMRSAASAGGRRGARGCLSGAPRDAGFVGLGLGAESRRRRRTAHRIRRSEARPAARRSAAGTRNGARRGRARYVRGIAPARSDAACRRQRRRGTHWRGVAGGAGMSETGGTGTMDIPANPARPANPPNPAANATGTTKGNRKGAACTNGQNNTTV